MTEVLYVTILILNNGTQSGVLWIRSLLDVEVKYLDTCFSSIVL